MAREFDPHTDATHTLQLTRIFEFCKEKTRTANNSMVPQHVAGWERVWNDYVEKVGEEPTGVRGKKDLLLRMLPEKLEEVFSKFGKITSYKLVSIFHFSTFLHFATHSGERSQRGG